MHIELFKGNGKQPWYIRLQASNGRTITTSEGYSTKANAKRAAKTVFPEVELRDLTGESEDE